MGKVMGTIVKGMKSPGLKYLVAIACLIYLFKNGKLDFQSLSDIAKNALLCFQVFFLLAVILLMGAWKWFIILRAQKIDMPFPKCFAVFYIGSAFNYILPGGIAGDLVKGGYMMKEQAGRSKAVLSILVDRVMGLFSMMVVVALLVPFSGGLFLDNGSCFFQNKSVAIPYVLGVLFLVFLAFRMAFYVLTRRRLYRKIRTFFYKRRNKNQAYKAGMSLVEALFLYRNSTSTLMQNVTIAAAIQIIIACCLFLIGASLAGAGEASLFGNVLASIITQLVGIIPLSPGGIGIGEAAFERIMSHLHSQVLCPYAAVYLAYRIYNILFGLPAIIMFVLGPNRLRIQRLTEMP